MYKLILRSDKQYIEPAPSTRDSVCCMNLPAMIALENKNNSRSTPYFRLAVRRSTLVIIYHVVRIFVECVWGVQWTGTATAGGRARERKGGRENRTKRGEQKSRASSELLRNYRLILRRFFFLILFSSSCPCISLPKSFFLMALFLLCFLNLFPSPTCSLSLSYLSS